MLNAPAIALCLLSQADPIVLAVFDIQDGRDGKDRLAPARIANLSDYLATLLAKDSAFKLVPSAEIKEALGNAKKESFKECYDDKCQIELGKALAAQQSMHASILKVGDQCVLKAAIFDLKREVTDRIAHFKGDCDETSVVAGIEIVVAELKGDKRQLIRDSAGKAVVFDTSRVGRIAELRPPAAPERVKGLDFSGIDLDELEIYDAAVQAEQDPNLSSSQKLKRWQEVKKRTKKFQTIAVERIAAWKSYIVEERAAVAAQKKLERQRSQDWKKLKRVLGISVLSDEDKSAWVDAFLRAYGSDPEKNPVLNEPLLRNVLIDRAWKKALDEARGASELVARERVIGEFIARYPNNPRASEAGALLERWRAARDEAARKKSECRRECKEAEAQCRQTAEQIVSRCRNEAARPSSCNSLVGQWAGICDNNRSDCHSRCDSQAPDYSDP